jgi:hypothetical protein
MREGVFEGCRGRAEARRTKVILGVVSRPGAAKPDALIPGRMLAPMFFRIPRRHGNAAPGRDSVGEESPDTAGQDAGQGAQAPSPGGALQGASTDSATENIPPSGQPGGKGEKVG